MSKQNLPTDALACASQLSTLPVFAQTLVASRFVRRAAKAMLDDAGQKIALRACDVLETISKTGKDASCDESILTAIVDMGGASSGEAAMMALRCAVEAIHAAKVAVDSLGAAHVTSSVRRCVDAVYADPRISRMQVAIVLNGDISQIRFSCAESGIGDYDGVSDQVLGRLTPCHAFSLFEPPRCIEDEYR